MKTCCAALLGLAWVVTVAAADLQAAREDLAREISAAAVRLEDRRTAISALRLPLVTALHELEAETTNMRRVADDRESVSRLALADHERLRADVERLRQDQDLTAALLRDFCRAFFARMNPAAAASFSTNHPAPLVDTPAVWNAWLPAALDEIEAAARPRRLLGSALDAGGREVQGVFTIIGPCVWFSAHADNGPVGLVTVQPGSTLPRVAPLAGRAHRAALRAWSTGEAAIVPVDVSGGEALRLRMARSSVWAWWRAGGPIMWPLGLAAVAAFYLALRRAHALARLIAPSPDQAIAIATACRTGDMQLAHEFLARMQAPGRDLLTEGVAQAHARSEWLEELLTERLEAIRPSLESRLGALAVLGGIAPLLGLLGTVTGMIHTFHLVTLFGAGDARLLSGGISEALITTQVGLVIAIPILIVHAYLARRVRTLIEQTESALLLFVQQLRQPQ